MSIALVMILAGAISMLVLPIAQYPPLVPPQVQVSTQYIGAGADVVANTVTTPLEEQINGAAGMIYMTSTSTNNGDSAITVTFDVGYDQDIGQMELLTRSNEAISELPPEVNQVGLTIQKHSSNMLLAVSLISPKGTYDGRFLQNYADIHITDALSRIPGVAEIENFGLSKYAMRIWLDPARLTNLGLTAMDVENAIKEQNQQVAVGTIGQAPAPARVSPFSISSTPWDAWSRPRSLKTSSCGPIPTVRLCASAMWPGWNWASEEYDWDTKLNGKPTATIIVFQLAEANGLQIKAVVTENMNRLAKHFPEDMQWVMRYDTTRVYHRVDQRSHRDPGGGSGPGGAGGVYIPAEFSGRPDSHHCRAGFSDRHLCLHENLRIFHQLVEHAGHGPGGGPGGGRCHRDRGKRHAQAGGRRAARHQGDHGRSRRRGARPHCCNDPGAYGGLCAGSVYPRHDRVDQQAVRPDDCHGGGPLRFQLPDPEPGPVRGLAAAGIRQKQCFFSGLQ